MKTLGEIVDSIDKIIDYSSAQAYDNVGLLIGNREQIINKVLFSLDLTKRAIDYAVDNEINLIITHHPIIFSSLKQVTNSDYTGDILLYCIKHNISVIATHTTRMQYFLNLHLADIIGIQNLREHEDFLVEGNALLREGESLLEMVGNVFAEFEYFGDFDGVNSCILCTGAGTDYTSLAYEIGTGCIITGEGSYHKIQASKVPVILLGHYETEAFYPKIASDVLKGCFEGIKCEVFYEENFIKKYRRADG